MTHDAFSDWSKRLNEMILASKKAIKNAIYLSHWYPDRCARDLNLDTCVRYKCHCATGLLPILKVEKKSKAK